MVGYVIMEPLVGTLATIFLLYGSHCAYKFSQENDDAVFYAVALQLAR